MAFYAVTYRYSDDEQTRMEVRPTHREWLAKLADAGMLMASGPLVNSQQPGALLIFQADDKANVEDLLTNDPFAEARVIIETTIDEWDVVIGGFGQAR
ncbi:MAG TPA: YciI family protein [Brevibacterium ravenspurgense]|nr:YciI family protein [Brevibacterium ravenspurgense]